MKLPSRFHLLLITVPGLLSTFPLLASADIYRFVTVDGVEIFTDAPNQKGAQIVIKSGSKTKTVKSTRRASEKTAAVSLDEIADKTVLARINPQQENQRPVDLKLPIADGIITSMVGMRVDPIDGKWRHHNGIDIAVREGTPVRPAGAGVVAYSGLRSGYGNTVLIEHDNGMITLYGHNSALMVTQGQVVNADTVIALSGNTGRSTGPHLHFEAWQGGLNVTGTFIPGGAQKLPQVQLASSRPKNRFHKQIMADGSILFTNIPSSIP